MDEVHDYSKTIVPYIISQVSQQSQEDDSQEGLTNGKIHNNKGSVDEDEIETEK